MLILVDTSDPTQLTQGQGRRSHVPTVSLSVLLDFDLRAADLFFREFAVPEIGRIWFARQVSWALAALALHEERQATAEADSDLPWHRAARGQARVPRRSAGLVSTLLPASRNKRRLLFVPHTGRSIALATNDAAAAERAIACLTAVTPPIVPRAPAP